MLNAQSFNRLFEDFFRDGFSADRFAQRRFYNAINIWQDDHELVITARAPGMNAEDIEVSMADGNLTLRGRVDGETCFNRSFALPCEINADATSATLQDGVLTLHLPVQPKVEPKRIAIRAI